MSRRSNRVVVVGAGVAGLAAAHRLTALDPSVDVVVLERASRVGGLVWTSRTPEGFLLEHGPDSFLADKPAAIELASELGIDGEVHTVGSRSHRAYVAGPTGLVPLPNGLMGVVPADPIGVLRSPSLSAMGKLRIALEPFIRPPPTDDDESIEQFVVRRFGRELHDRIVAPMLSSIYGAEPAALSADAVIPRLRQLERAYGRVSAPLLWGRAGGRAHGGSKRGAPTRRSGIVSFRDGMGTLPQQLAERLGARVRLGLGVSRLSRGALDRFDVELESGERIPASAVIVATSADRAARLISEVAAGAAGDLAAIEMTSVAIVHLGLAGSAVGRLPNDASGLLLARSRRRVISACTVSSRKLTGRAPEGFTLLRCFVRDGLGSDDAELVQHVRADLRDLMGLEAAPAFFRVTRIASALPRYAVGHLERVARIEQRLAAEDGLALAGNAFRGVGVPDTVRSGHLAAESVLRVINRGASSVDDRES